MKVKEMLKQILSIINLNNNQVMQIYDLKNRLAQKIKLYLLYRSFINKQKHYIENKPDNIIRRLFITTGSISLINSLALMKQFNFFKKEYRNDVIVHSHIARKEFFDTYEIVLRIFGINNVFFIDNNPKKVYYYILNHCLTNYDEVYFVNLDYFHKYVQKLYVKAKLNLIDEGAYTIPAIKNINYDRISNFIAPCYLNKIDNIDNTFSEKFIELKKENFIYIAEKCRMFLPLNFEFENDKKYIIFCGQYVAIGKCISLKESFEVQNEIMHKLQAKGYTVLFKPHPRDLMQYHNNENFKVINSKLPLECYDLTNVLAVVSVFSSVCLQVYHYYNTASFIIKDLIPDNGNLIQLAAEYTPSVEELFKIDTNCSVDELRKKISDMYENYLKDKPKLSENKNFIEFLRA